MVKPKVVAVLVRPRSHPDIDLELENGDPKAQLIGAQMVIQLLHRDVKGS